MSDRFSERKLDPAALQRLPFPGSVPSTTTRLRSMPRMWMCGLVTITPAGRSSGWPLCFGPRSASS